MLRVQPLVEAICGAVLTGDLAARFRALSVEPADPAPSTNLLLDRLHGRVLGTAVDAAEIHAQAAAVHRWTDELQERVGSTDQVSQVRVHGLLNALASTTERLSELTRELADSLAGLSAGEDGGDQARAHGVQA